MAAKKLVSFVHVDGEVYGPDSDVPADVARRITNPNAWSGSTADAEGEGDKPEDEKPPAKKAAAKKATSAKS